MTPRRVMLVTGATGGIGEAVVELAVARGYRLALAARSASALRQLVIRVGEETAIGVPCDVGRWEDVQRLVDTTLSAFGRVDCVFANAGIGARRSLLDGDPLLWRSLLETNVLGVAHTIRAAVPHLRTCPGGHIVLMGSVAGRWITPGSFYAATKASVSALADALRQELREMGDVSTRVTVIEAGWVATQLLKGERPGAMPPAEIAQAVFYALDRPRGTDINQITVRPTTQRE
jgi:NADP-dependent 3-hydroxy acid dehydrogenase YdfG